MAKEIWICEHEKVTKWDGDILGYKNHLKNKVMREANKDAKSKFFLYFSCGCGCDGFRTQFPQRRVWRRRCAGPTGRPGLLARPPLRGRAEEVERHSLVAALQIEIQPTVSLAVSRTALRQFLYRHVTDRVSVRTALISDVSEEGS